MRNPPRPRVRGEKARGGVCGSGGGSTRRHQPERERSSPRGGLRLQDLAQKDRGGVTVLTEVLFGSEMPRCVVIGEVWVAVRGGARGGDRCWSSPGLLICPGDAQPCCEQEPGVREARNSPAV